MVETADLHGYVTHHTHHPHHKTIGTDCTILKIDGTAFVP